MSELIPGHKGGYGVPGDVRERDALDAKNEARWKKPLSEWTDAELAAGGPVGMPGAASTLGISPDLVAKEIEGRASRKDSLKRIADQPGRKQTVLTDRAPSVFGKPIL